LELIKYVWKPERPTMDQTEKKHTTASSTVRLSQGGKRRGGFTWLLRGWDDLRLGRPILRLLACLASCPFSLSCPHQFLYNQRETSFGWGAIPYSPITFQHRGAFLDR
jgi:hypothetical protein